MVDHAKAQANGHKGGTNRAKNLSAKRRLEISKLALKVRWNSAAKRKAHSEALKAAHARRRAKAAKAAKAGSE